eukprot:Gb_34573 [translate_table: standard]
MAGLAAGVVVGHVPILKRSVEGGNSGHKRLTNGNNGQKIDESPLRHDLCNRIVWICQKGRYGESNRSLPLAHVPGRIAWFPGANLLKKNSRSCLMKPLSRSRLVAIRALAMEVAKEAFLPEEGEMKSDRGKYKMDGGLSTIYRPPPNRADDPSLGNPLLRLKRMGCGWLGVIIEWEGVIVEDDPDLESKAWLALAEEEGKRPPPAFILKRVEGMKNEQALSEVLCWSRDPVQLRRLALRKEDLYQEMQGGFYRLKPGSREFVSTLKKYDIPIALVSTRPRKYLEMAIEAVGMEGFCNVVLAAEDVYRGKPDPEMFMYASQLLNFISERCIVFGNSNSSVEAAHDICMKCVAVAGKHPMFELGAADMVVRRLDELSLVDLKNLADLDLPEFEPPEPEPEPEVEAEGELAPPTSVAVQDMW